MLNECRREELQKNHYHIIWFFCSARYLMHFYDVVIVGGGPSGLAAAISAKDQGLDNVLILEKEEELGGMLRYFIHNNFGENIFGRSMTGPEYIQRFIDKAIRLGIEYKVNTTVIDIYDDKSIYAVNEIDGIMHIKAKAIVVATGCREMLRGLDVPRTRCTGIFTCGLVHKIVNQEGFLPGRNIIIYGINRYTFLVARRLKVEGANVKIITSKRKIPQKYKKAECELVEEFKIPIIFNSSIEQIFGKDRIKGVNIFKFEKNGEEIIKVRQEIGCDTLLISAQFYPETKILKNTSVKIDDLNYTVLIDENCSTNVSGIFACGNVTKKHEAVEGVTIEGLSAGKNVASYFVKDQYAVNS